MCDWTDAFIVAVCIPMGGFISEPSDGIPTSPI